jgi:hypothetical protein
MKKKNKFHPKCLNSLGNSNPYGKPLSFSTTGHVVPCCWVNGSFNDPRFAKLFAPEMHLDNFEKIEDVFEHENWKSFTHDLLNGNQPPKCSKNCNMPLNKNTDFTEETYVKFQ